MPWTVEKKGSQFCVFKQGADKHPTGEALKCYATNSEAQDYMKALYANEPEARERSLLQEIWAKLREFFAPVEEQEDVERVIKDVSAWDGNSNQWDSPASFAEDCLINANPAAGKTSPDQWTKALCYLPIRGPDDPNTTFVRQAAHACAGGRGISRLVKPAEVPAAEWAKLVKTAAKKLISIYGQMDETPPDSMYVTAGEQVPKRAVSIEQISNAVAQQLNAQGFWLTNLYEENGKLVAIVVSQGKIYRAPIAVAGTTVTLGELAEIELQFQPVPGAEPPMPAPMAEWAEEMTQTGRMTILRQADGHYRWFAITESAVLNRVGEIDSRALFDSFIAHAQTDGYPALRFYHTKGLDFGRADWLAREDNLYLASGTFDEEHPIARAMIQDAADGHSGVVWGISNGFLPTVSPAMVEITEGIKLPVYTQGVHREISVLPERSAASLFTVFQTTEVTMRSETREALKKLLKDDALVAKIEAEVDQTNRSITDQGLVTRDQAAPDAAAVAPATEQSVVAETAPAVEVATAVVPGAEAEEKKPDPVAETKPVEPARIVLDPETMAEIAKLVSVPAYEPPALDIAGAMNTALKTYLDPVITQLNALADQVAGLQREVDGKAQVRKEDMPARREVIVTHRPREAQAGDPAVVSMADRAADTLSKFPKLDRPILNGGATLPK